MTLKDILEKCSNLRIDEKRVITDDYNELVFYNQDIDEWNKIFTELFGSAIKPSGRIPSENDLQLSKDYGGIYDNQTLFKTEFDGTTVIAMFWPWRDDIHTTLKLARLKK